METKNRIPLWLAVAITVMVALPFGIYLGKWSLPIWASFIVWAEYFALGAKPKVLTTIVPAYIVGVVVAAVIMLGDVWLTNVFGTAKMHTSGDIALFVSCFVGFCVFLYWMKWLPILQTGTLPYFNGISMLLAVYFVNSFVPFGTLSSAYWGPIVAAVGAILAGLLGAFLGWFNVAILFPHQVKTQPTSAPQLTGSGPIPIAH